MGSGLTLPLVPNRDSGKMSEVWFVNEQLTKHQMQLLHHELHETDSLVDKVLFRRCQFNKHVKRFIDALETTHDLREVVIEDCDMGAYADAICSALRTNQTATSLTCCANKIQTANINAKSLEAKKQTSATFAELLPVGSYLQHLCLSRNGLTSEDVHELAFTLKMSPTGHLTALDISHNCIGVEGAMTIAHSLHTNKTLRFLDVSANELCGVDAKGEGFYDPNGIRNLCNVLLETNRLDSLAVGSNHMMATGALLVVDLLEHSTSLTSLDIGGSNYMCRDEKREHQHNFHSRYYSGTLVKLTNVLKKSELITALDVSGSDMRYEGAITLATCLPKVPSLVSLNIANNALCGNNKESSYDAFKQLIKALSNKNTVTQLDLSKNSLKAEGMLLIAEWLSNPHSVITDLNVSDNELSCGKLNSKPLMHANRYKYAEDNSGIKELGQALDLGVLRRLDLRKNGSVTGYYSSQMQPKTKWKGEAILDPVIVVEEKSPKKGKKPRRKKVNADASMGDLLTKK